MGKDGTRVGRARWCEWMGKDGTRVGRPHWCEWMGKDGTRVERPRPCGMGLVIGVQCRESPVRMWQLGEVCVLVRGVA
jgi:hypothetical protein